MFQSIIFTFLTFTLVNKVTANDALGSATLSDIRVEKCAKCFFLEGDNNMITPLLQAVPMPDQDYRCKYWNDGIPETQYEECGSPFDGEANSCLFLNMTITMKNIVTDGLGAFGDAVNGAIDVVADPIGAINDALGNPVGAIDNVVSNPIGAINDAAGNPMGSVGDAISDTPIGAIGGVLGGGSGFLGNAGGGGGGGFLGNNGGGGGGFPWGRKKRQVAGRMGRTRPPRTNVVNPNGEGRLSFTDITDQFGNVISSGTGQVGSAIDNAIPGIQISNFIPSSDGNYQFKLFYKGCVRLSILETLSGSHCRLDPEFNDIQFFSQQSLLQPMMEVVNVMTNGLAGFAGTNVTVDGLCYIMKKEFTKQIWKALLHYDPKWLGGL